MQSLQSQDLPPYKQWSTRYPLSHQILNHEKCAFQLQLPSGWIIQQESFVGQNQIGLAVFLNNFNFQPSIRNRDETHL